jgi:outer membrane immunogenic protein
MGNLRRAICKGSLFVFTLGVADAALAGDWTRYYGGFSLSSQSAKAEWTTTGLGTGPTFPITTNPAENLGPSSWRYGLYGGKNWQLAEKWVAGVDVSLGDGGRTRTLPGTPGWGGATSSDAISVSSKWNASIDARVGYTVTPDVLVFGTLGYAWQKFDGRYVCPGNATSWCIASRDEAKSWNRGGLEYGVGVEWSFASRWTARADYRDARLGSTNDVWFSNAPIDAVVSRITFKTQTVNVGVAYQF